MCVAPIRLRLLAAFVDAAVVIGGIAALVALGVAGGAAYACSRGYGDDQDGSKEDEQQGVKEDAPDGDERDERPDKHWTSRAFGQSRELRAALLGASAGTAVASRNWRSPGYRVVGLRRVDAQTGGIVSVRSALVGVLFDQAFRAVARPLFRSRAKRELDHMSSFATQLKLVEDEYADDPQARRRAVIEFCESNEVRPLVGCGWQLAGLVVSQLFLAVGSTGGRTVRDRVSGTSVIVDR
jgi:hypothetical protein